MKRDQLKSLIEQLSDGEYFFLARNYLGLIESPFHKEYITDRLVAFFTIEEHQEKIISLIDPFDQIIITALLFSGPLSFANLATLLEGLTSYGTLLLRVANLRERLIIISSGKLLTLNPLLEDRLKTIASLTPLFELGTEQAHTHPFTYAELIQGLLTLAERPSRSFYRKEYDDLFPTFDPQTLPHLFETIYTSFVELGIVIEEPTRHVNWARANYLLGLDEVAMKALLLSVHIEGNGDAALYTCSFDFIYFTTYVDSVHHRGLSRVAHALGLKHHTKGCDIEQVLLGLGLGVTTKHGFAMVRYAEAAPVSSFVVDSDYSVSFLGSLPTDGLLARFASLETLDQTRLWRITEERLLAALDGGISFDEIKTYIQEESNGSLNTTLLKALTLIAERSTQAIVYDGLLLKTDERVSRIVDQLPSIQEHILVRLAPATFLMSRKSERIWRQILTQAGLSLGATKGEVAPKSVEQHIEYPDLQWPKYIEADEGLNIMMHVDEAVVDETLKAKIEAQGFKKDQERDLLERVDERLIITESQIAPQVLYTRIEAGGFDYQGKISLAKNAAAKEGTIVQLFMGSEEVMALALELTYTPTKEALFKVSILPQMETRVIPLSKIFLLRQIKMLFL
ncbi:MAG: hypothetical protein WC954_00545 [Sphaerochaeta sp.]